VSYLPDELLARRAAAGQIDCFEELLRRHRDRVFRLCYRMAGNAEDAEDWAQICFVHAYQQLGRYDPTRPFAPWLAHVAANICINELRRRQRRDRFPLGLADDAAATEIAASGNAAEDPAHAALNREEQVAVREALTILSPLLRQAVALRIEEEMSFREMAEILGVPLQTASSRVRRAVLQVRQYLLRSGGVKPQQRETEAAEKKR